MSKEKTISMRWLRYPKHTPLTGIEYSVFGLNASGEELTDKGFYTKLNMAESEDTYGFTDTPRGLTNDTISHFGWPKEMVPAVGWHWKKDQWEGRSNGYRVGYIYQNTATGLYEAMYSLPEKVGIKYGSKPFDTTEKAQEYIENKFAQFYLDISLLTKK